MNEGLTLRCYVPPRMVVFLGHNVFDNDSCATPVDGDLIGEATPTPLAGLERMLFHAR